MEFDLMDSYYCVTSRNEPYKRFYSREEAIAYLVSLQRKGKYADLEIKERIRIKGWQNLNAN